MKDNDVIMDEVCGLMSQGTYYPVNVIKENYITIFEDEESSKKISQLLSRNSKKKNPKILRDAIGGNTVYSLNPEFNFEDERKVAEASNIENMAKVIRKMVHSQNLKALDVWLNNDLIKVIDTIVEDRIKQELTNEVVPVLKDFINSEVDGKIKSSKSSFKKLLLEVISDIIKLTDED